MAYDDKATELLAETLKALDAERRELQRQVNTLAPSEAAAWQANRLREKQIDGIRDVLVESGLIGIDHSWVDRIIAIIGERSS